MIGPRAALLVLAVALGCYPGYSAPRPETVTQDVVRTMRRLVDSVTRLQGRPPTSLDEACTRLAPSYARPRCAYWLHDSDTLPLDGWRNPLRYETTGSVIAIQSAGADGAFGTADDMGFNSEEERKRVAAAPAAITRIFGAGRNSLVPCCGSILRLAAWGRSRSTRR